MFGRESGTVSSVRSFWPLGCPLGFLPCLPASQQDSELPWTQAGVPELSLIRGAVRVEGSVQDLVWPGAWHIVGAQQITPQPHAVTTLVGL